MKTTAWRWLVLLLIPGCLLVQPLDEAKPDGEDSAGGAGKAPMGSAGKHAGGGGPSAAGGSGPSNAGSGNRGGSGPVASGGGPNDPNAEFSIFLGEWTLVGGQSTITCDVGTQQTQPVDTGGVDTFGLGSISDLIFNPGTSCELLADVSSRTASLNPATSDCSYSGTDGYYYDLTFDAFQFVVSSNGQTAKASMTSTVYVYDGDDNYLSTCDTQYAWDYAR